LASSRILIRGAVLALVAAVLALTGGVLGIDTLWPVLLAAAIGLSAAPLSPGRAGAFVAGILVAWVALAVQAGLLPDMAASRAIVIVLGIAVITAIAAATADLAPLWAGLAGYAAFAALYEPVLAASPTTFLADSFVALVTVMLATAFGFGAALLGDLAAAMRPGSEHTFVDGEVA
jgi:hypothetical protein